MRRPGILSDSDVVTPEAVEKDIARDAGLAPKKSILSGVPDGVLYLGLAAGVAVGLGVLPKPSWWPF